MGETKEVLVRLDSDIYSEFSEVCWKLGVSVDEALNEFAKKTVELQMFPIEIDVEDEQE